MRVVLLSTLLFAFGTLSYLRGFLNLTLQFAGAGDAKVPVSDPVATRDSPHRKSLELEAAPFDNLVFVLIDALRNDNVFPVDGGDGPMTFVQKCVESGKAIGFISHGQPPTVTLPRIKALTSGSVPGFADVIFNFFAAESKGANIVANLKKAGKKLVFYGDDTWLKIFPGHFARFDGTTSFFVNDYTTVDDNVTRHLDAELSTRDWDALILHYLGLDHIGHTAGPYSHLVAPKLEEMDSVIRRLTEGVSRLDAASGRSTLVVVTGDHGMSNLGSHGGSTKEEIQSPLLFIANEWRRGGGEDAASLPARMAPLRNVQQIDVAPTLAYLMGVAVPDGSKGIAIPEVIAAASSPSYSASAFLDNLHHLCPSSDCGANASALRLRLDSLVNRPDGDSVVVNRRLIDNVVATLEKIQAAYLGSASRYLFAPMAVGAALQVVALAGLILSAAAAGSNSIHRSTSSTLIIAIFVVIVFSLFVASSSSPSPRLFWSQTSLLEVVGVVVAAVVGVFFCVYDLTLPSFTVIPSNLTPSAATAALNASSSSPSSSSSSSSSSASILLNHLDALFAIVCLLVHAATLASSSFVEEEHFTWYFLVNSSLLFLFLRHFFPAQSSSSGHSVSGAKHESFSPDSSLNSSSFEISYSWEDRAGAAGLKDDVNGGVGRRLYRRGTGNIAFLNPSSDESSLNSSMGSSHVSTGNGSAIVPQLSMAKPAFRLPELAVVKNLVSLVFLLRVIKSWNPTGLKWNDLATISTVIIQPEYELVLFALVLASLFYATVGAWTKESVAARIILALGGVAVLAFRSRSLPWLLQSAPLTIDPLLSSRLVFLLVLLLVFLSFVSGLRSVVAPLCLLTLLLARLHNIPLVALHLLATKTASRLISVSKISFHPLFLAFLFYSYSQFGFFSQGTCNSLASVDVSASTVGLTVHQPVFSGLLMTFATYSLPLLWLVTLFEVRSKEIKVEVSVGNEDKEMLTQAEKVRRDESTLIRAASSAYSDPKTFLTSLRVLKKDMHHLMKLQEAGGQNNIDNDTVETAVTSKKLSSAVVLRIIKFLLVCRTLPVAFFSFVVFIHRYHLFIWSVFAPKLLFEAMNFAVIASFSVVVACLSRLM